MSTAERGNGEQGESELMEDYLIPEYILNGEAAPANATDLPIPRCHPYFDAPLGEVMFLCALLPFNNFSEVCQFSLNCHLP